MRISVAQVGLFPNLINAQFLFQIAQDRPVVSRRDNELLLLADAAAQIKRFLSVFCRQVRLSQVAVSSRQKGVCRSKVRVQFDCMFEEWNGRGASYRSHRLPSQIEGFQRL